MFDAGVLDFRSTNLTFFGKWIKKWRKYVFSVIYVLSIARGMDMKESPLGWLVTWQKMEWCA